MNEQLDLFAVPKAATNSLFLALIPDPEVVARIAELAADLQARHTLTGRLRSFDHLHLTLHWLGDFADVPSHLVSAVERACEAVACSISPIEVTMGTCNAINISATPSKGSSAARVLWRGRSESRNNAGLFS